MCYPLTNRVPTLVGDTKATTHVGGPIAVYLLDWESFLWGGPPQVVAMLSVSL